MKHLKGGVEINVLTRKEHPPPHVHIEHQAQGWEIKVEFSYIENIATTYKITHLFGKLPTKARLNTIVQEVMSSRRECRDVWWDHVSDAGLANKWVVVNAGKASPATPNVAGAFSVSTAVYDDPTQSMKFNGIIVGECP
ncbi:hypothetical protein ABIB42_002266 [Massilia sp. UYP32]|uniref:hypothetical protein n=1 Tax=Massilia sp. UYP32 TaxID=1756386 RepID=UPI003D2239A2